MTVEEMFELLSEDDKEGVRKIIDILLAIQECRITNDEALDALAALPHSTKLFFYEYLNRLK